MNAYNEVNPGFRLYYLDPETFEPVNYDQYYFDIEAAMGTYHIPHHKELHRWNLNIMATNH